MGVTMNRESIDSLISAYHDGELNAAERAEVDQLLAASPQAQAELASYREMSAMLRDCRRPALSADLAPLVMQAIVQPTTAPAVSQPLRANTPARKWTRWVTVAAVAAGLILAVRVSWRPAHQAAAIANVERPNPEITPRHPEGAQVSPESASIPKTVVPAAASANIAANDNRQPVDGSTSPSTPSPVAPGSAVKVIDKPAGLQLAASDIPIDVIENLKTAKPQRIVRFLKNSGEDVAVFHLMVLDVKPGLDSLQMILSAQQISGPEGAVGQPGVIAVYVEANQDQMDKVIAELQSKEQEQFVALAVQKKPVKSEAVEQVVGSKVAALDSQQVPVKQGQLDSLGVAPVRNEQVVAAVNDRTSMLQRPPLSSNGNANPTRKVLIILEKVPESLLPATDQPN